MPDTIIRPGLDVLCDGDAAEIHSFLSFLQTKRAGLLTNHTGQTQNGQPALEVLRSLGVEVRALFSPEHGPAGKLEGDIASSHTPDGLPEYSLYGETRRPTAAMLDNLQVLICDLQDVGARFYTYASTIFYAMEECAARDIPVVILDRPNPLGGEVLEGPLLEDAHRSFVGDASTPIRHGMTLGELAIFQRAAKSLNLDLQIVPVVNWRREMQWPQTGLNWIAPSPNLPDFNSAAWYPGLCLLEFSGVSVGRGTDAPFQILGAPWLEPKRVLSALPSLDGFQYETLEFMPTRGEWANQLCRGVLCTHENSAPPQPVALGMALLSTLHQTHPEHFGEKELRASLPLLGSSAVLEMLRVETIKAAFNQCKMDCATFASKRRDFLLYE